MVEVKKQRRSGRRLVKGILFLIICVVTLGAVVYFPIFTLQEIKLNGAIFLTEEDILKVGDIYINEPLFQLETDKVASRLMKDVRVEDVTIHRRLPHTLEVNIVERVPIATMVCNYGYLDMDKHGKILDFLQLLDAASLNKISEVAIVAENYVVAYTNSERAVQIRIGALERLEEKAHLTEDFLRDLETNPNAVEYVDFNYTAPFIKLYR